MASEVVRLLKPDSGGHMQRIFSAFSWRSGTLEVLGLPSLAPLLQALAQFSPPGTLPEAFSAEEVFVVRARAAPACARVGRVGHCAAQHLTPRTAHPHSHTHSTWQHWANITASVMQQSEAEEFAACVALAAAHDASAPFLAFRVFPAFMSELATRLYPLAAAAPPGPAGQPAADPLSVSRQRFMRKNVLPLSSALAQGAQGPSEEAAAPPSPVPAASPAAASVGAAALLLQGDSEEEMEVVEGQAGSSLQLPSHPASPVYAATSTFSATRGLQQQQQQPPARASSAPRGGGAYSDVPSRYHMPPSPKGPPPSDVTVGVRPIGPQQLAGFLDRQAHMQAAKEAKIAGLLEAEQALEGAHPSVAAECMSRGSRAILERLEGAGVGRHGADAAQAAAQVAAAAAAAAAAAGTGSAASGLEAAPSAGDALYAAALARRARQQSAVKEALGAAAQAAVALRPNAQSEAIMRKRLTRECAAACVFIARRRAVTAAARARAFAAAAAASSGSSEGSANASAAAAAAAPPSTSFLWWQLELAPAELALLAQALGLFGDRGTVTPEEAHAAVVTQSGDARCEAYAAAEAAAAGGGGSGSSGSGGGGGHRIGGPGVESLLQLLARLWAACSTLGAGEGGWAVLESLSSPASASASGTAPVPAGAAAEGSSSLPLLPAVRVLAVLQALVTGAYDVRPSLLAAAAVELGMGSAYIHAPPASLPALPRQAGSAAAAASTSAAAAAPSQHPALPASLAGSEAASPSTPPRPAAAAAGGEGSFAPPPPPTPSSFTSAIEAALQEANVALRSRLLPAGASAPPTPDAPAAAAAPPSSTLHPLAAAVISARATFPAALLAPLRQMYFNRLAHTTSLRASDGSRAVAEGIASDVAGPNPGANPQALSRSRSRGGSSSSMRGGGHWSTNEHLLAHALSTHLPGSAAGSVVEAAGSGSVLSSSDSASLPPPPALPMPLGAGLPPSASTSAAGGRGVHFKPPHAAAGAHHAHHAPHHHHHHHHHQRKSLGDSSVSTAQAVFLRGPRGAPGHNARAIEEANAQCTFEPALCARSLELAAQAASRRGADPHAPVANHLVDYKLRSQAHLRAKRLEKEAAELSACTFKPVLVSRRGGGGEEGAGGAAGSASSSAGGGGGSSAASSLYLPNYASLIATAAGAGGSAGLGAGAEAAREARSSHAALVASTVGGEAGEGSSSTAAAAAAATARSSRHEWLYHLAQLKSNALTEAARVSEAARNAAEDAACTFHPTVSASAGSGEEYLAALLQASGAVSGGAGSSGSGSAAAAAAAAAAALMTASAVSGVDEHIARARKAREEREDMKARVEALSLGVLQKSALVRDPKGLTVTKPFKMALDLRASQAASAVAANAAAAAAAAASHSAAASFSSSSRQAAQAVSSSAVWQGGARTHSILESSSSAAAAAAPASSSTLYDPPTLAAPQPPSLTSTRAGGVQASSSSSSSSSSARGVSFAPAPAGSEAASAQQQQQQQQQQQRLTAARSPPSGSASPTPSARPSAYSSPLPESPPSGPPGTASSMASGHSSSSSTLLYAAGEPPLLYVDVTVTAGTVERLPVWRDSDLGVLAAEFADKHGLPKKMAKRLEKLMEEQRTAIGEVLR